jgi:nicotinamide-nucleotide amidase
MRAICISTGNELLLGQTVDANSAWLSRRLAELGVIVSEHRTVGDEAGAIARVILQAAQEADWVIVTGGLGPTPDDQTREALAEAVGSPLAEDPTSLAQIEEYFARMGRAMPPPNRVQARLPKGCQPLANPCGTAPGILGRLGRCQAALLPGVPSEMEAMFEQHLAGPIAEAAGGRAILTHTLRCFGTGESQIGAMLADLMQTGRNPAIGTTASEGVIGVRLWATGDLPEAARQLLQESATEVRRRLGVLVFGEGDQTLAEVVGGLLRKRGKTLALAESCTGGWMAKAITDVAGSSDYFLRGYVTYANQAKTEVLDVAAELIALHGAVSSEVAEAMAIGCRERAGSDYALSVTGIAGPTGGTPDKPVGLIWLGLASPDGVATRELRWNPTLSRESIRSRTVQAGLNWLRLVLLDAANLNQPKKVRP